jgi:probable rRNA maturation factor
VNDPVPQPRGQGAGGITVMAADQQDRETVDTERLARLAERVLHAEAVSGDVEMTLVFVPDDTIADLNLKFMGHEGPTDVLSFPIDDALVGDRRGREPSGSGPGRRAPEPPDAPPVLLGDVVSCPSVARANAPAHAGDYDDELALLVVHGVLHLLGHDHAVDAERVAMQARERTHLEQFWSPLSADPWGGS